MFGHCVGTRLSMTPRLPGESWNLPFKQLENYLYSIWLYGFIHCEAMGGKNTGVQQVIQACSFSYVKNSIPFHSVILLPYL